MVYAKTPVDVYDVPYGCAEEASPPVCRAELILGDGIAKLIRLYRRINH